MIYIIVPVFRYALYMRPAQYLLSTQVYKLRDSLVKFLVTESNEKKESLVQFPVIVDHYHLIVMEFCGITY